MLSSAFGVFLVATSHIDLEPTIYFLPIAITVASQLFGIRESTYWFFATLVHFTIYYTTVYGVSSTCLLYTSPSPRDQRGSRMPSSA